MNKTPAENLIYISGLEKTYRETGENLTIFSGLNMTVKRGSKTLILGESGSGKKCG